MTRFAASLAVVMALQPWGWSALVAAGRPPAEIDRELVANVFADLLHRAVTRVVEARHGGELRVRHLVIGRQPRGAREQAAPGGVDQHEAGRDAVTVARDRV